MSHQITHQATLETEVCCNCSILFALPTELQSRLKRDGGLFYCPNGHSQHYTETTVARLQRELTASKCETTAERLKRQEAEASLNTLKDKVSKGICPCCRRTFQNVKRHMAHMHPKYKPKTK